MQLPCQCPVLVQSAAPRYMYQLAQLVPTWEVETTGCTAQMANTSRKRRNVAKYAGNELIQQHCWESSAGLAASATEIPFHSFALFMGYNCANRGGAVQILSTGGDTSVDFKCLRFAQRVARCIFFTLGCFLASHQSFKWHPGTLHPLLSLCHVRYCC